MPNATVTEVRERPILFSGPMVRAILEGRKTQTRRVVVDRAKHEDGWVTTCPGEGFTPELVRRDFTCPYGEPGDRLWVRESGWQPKEPSEQDLREGADTWPKYVYDADEPLGACYSEWGWKHRPSIHMPRWASRLTREITDVRVERLQEISEADARAEGFPLNHNDEAYTVPPIGGTREWNNYGIASLSLAWDKLNAKRGYGWHANPWVWALTFVAVPQ